MTTGQEARQRSIGQKAPRRTMGLKALRRGTGIVEACEGASDCSSLLAWRGELKGKGIIGLGS